MRDTAPAQFSNNVRHQRFELVESGLTAFATYRRSGDRLVIPHVESPPPLRGKGTADHLMRAIAIYAGEHALKVTPLCGYARAWFRRHPEHAGLLD
jgi:predicted GNAT family acetyltransferase